MLTTQSAGGFFVRIKEFPEFPEIEGKIMFIRKVGPEGVQVSFTDDCRPSEKVYQLPPTVNDNGWYNVTSMIMMANTVILPKYDRCVFANEVAMSYRNHIDVMPAPLDETRAQGTICMLGSVNNRVISLTKQAYYVVACDDQGYILAYSGFCQPLEEWEKPSLQQRVLRLVGTGRHLYPAEQIVAECNAAYQEDLQVAQNFATNIEETVAASSSDTGVGQEVFAQGIHKLQLR